MIGLIVRRLIQLPLILLVLYTVTFVLAGLLGEEAVDASQDVSVEGPAEPAVRGTDEESYNFV